MSVLERQLVEIGRRVLETEHFGPGATMESLPEWTSLRHVLLLGEIAASFGADIRIEDAYRLDSFARLIAHLQPGIAAPAVAPVAAEAGPSEASPEHASIGALFFARAQALGDRPFLIFPKDGVTFSYRASLAMASAAARRL
ncbi:MAG: hypothetical protein JNL98_43730, partial [Bryobacterales bacterium]|nr:hypothetical protein [Bryobacterales bacterium]